LPSREGDHGPAGEAISKAHDNPKPPSREGSRSPASESKRGSRRSSGREIVGGGGREEGARRRSSEPVDRGFRPRRALSSVPRSYPCSNLHLASTNPHRSRSLRLRACPPRASLRDLRWRGFPRATGAGRCRRTGLRALRTCVHGGHHIVATPLIGLHAVATGEVASREAAVKSPVRRSRWSRGGRRIWRVRSPAKRF